MAKWKPGHFCGKCNHAWTGDCYMVCPQCGHRPDMNAKNANGYYGFEQCSVRKPWPWGKVQIKRWVEEQAHAKG